MARNSLTDDDLSTLIRLTDEAAKAYIRGDVEHYLTLIRHADDYTLMAPSGGEIRRGFDSSEENLEATRRMFQWGEASLEVAEAYSSGDLAVLVGVEYQHGEVGGLPDQDWSLRVTMVFRREDDRWRLAHRHADPLVHEIGPQQLSALAAGRGL